MGKALHRHRHRTYRTGSNYQPEELGFSWDFTECIRILYNRRGEKILTTGPTGEHEVAINAAGKPSDLAFGKRLTQK